MADIPEYTIETAPAGCLWTSHSGETYMRVNSTRSRISQEKRSFGVTDKKGREIGGCVTISKQVNEPRFDGESGTISGWAGTRIVCSPHALRDGEFFGASQADHYFKSMDEANTYVAKYFAAAAKRAAKSA